MALLYGVDKISFVSVLEILIFQTIAQMNFSQAVKNCFTRSGKLQAIHTAAEIELGRPITKHEISSLSTRFSLDEVYINVQKVKIKTKYLLSEISIINLKYGFGSILFQLYLL